MRHSLHPTRLGFLLSFLLLGSLSAFASSPLSVQQIPQVIRTAKAYLGTPHQLGGMSHQGIDCSGLMVVSFGSADFELPRISRDQAKVGKSVKRNDLLPGDLIFFQQGRRVDHVGLVIESTDQEIRFIHTSKSKGVMVSSLKTGAYWNRYFHSARRVWKGKYKPGATEKKVKRPEVATVPMTLRPVGDYPQTAERVLRRKELKQLNLHTRTIMEAEILARHGYRFRERNLRRHFSEQAWYQGISKEKKKRRVLKRLSPIEKKNYQRLQKLG
ncbi:MAG: NlpC/P60 family protein [Bacteroidota bacterium]